MDYSKKSILKWILLCLVIGVFAYAAIYYFFFYKKGEYSFQKQQITTNNEVASWQTYANSQYKFEFKYPLDWKKSSPGIVLTSLKGGLYQPALIINTYQNANCDSIEDFLKKIPTSKIKNQFGDVISTLSLNSDSIARVDSIEGLSEYKATWNVGDLIDPKNNEVSTNYYFRNGKGCPIIGVELSNFRYNPGVYGQILSTFKFTK